MNVDKILNVNIIEKFSSYFRLVRVTTYVLRFIEIENLEKKIKN